MLGEIVPILKNFRDGLYCFFSVHDKKIPVIPAQAGNHPSKQSIGQI